ncbi:MAG TPA: YlbF family regulator [Symbiobacteriaceae bacterium]|nr:YlbF family regulator [Symbiobacteriaceae bacterium]
MVNVYDYAHSLARALKEAPEYRAFVAARTKLKARPSAEEMVRDFHKKQLDLQTLIMQGKEPPKEQKEALERLYAVISGDSDVREFLTAEQRFSVILNDVYKILGEAVDVEIPGFERGQ